MTDSPKPDPNVLEFKNSSNLVGAKFDPATGILEVTFQNGKAVSYAKFTAELMREWAEAKSAGTWFHANIRQRPDAHPVVGPDGKVDATAPAPAPVPQRAAAPVETPAPPKIIKPAAKQPEAEPKPVKLPPIDHHAGKKRTAARVAAHRALMAGHRVKKPAPAPTLAPAPST